MRSAQFSVQHLQLQITVQQLTCIRWNVIVFGVERCTHSQRKWQKIRSSL